MLEFVNSAKKYFYLSRKYQNGNQDQRTYHRRVSSKLTYVGMVVSNSSYFEDAVLFLNQIKHRKVI